MAMAITASYSLTAQVAINQDDSNPDPSAMLDIKSTNKGLLPPRMTEAEIELIVNPADGLMVYNTDDRHLYIFNEITNLWQEVAIGTGTITPPGACGSDFTDSRDGQFYSTVQIGTQCWMAENLNVGTRIDGANNQIDNGTMEKYCYDDDVANCDTYGGLYQWDEMMQYTTDTAVQGICPDGWHLPTDNEWKTMEMELGMSQSEANGAGYRGTDEGEKMKSTSGWLYNGNGTNTSGFTALPGGVRYFDGGFEEPGTNGDWWSSTMYDGLNSVTRDLEESSDQVGRYGEYKTNGFSVRCLKD